jgi:hypothetical protein
MECTNQSPKMTKKKVSFADDRDGTKKTVNHEDSSSDMEAMSISMDNDRRGHLHTVNDDLAAGPTATKPPPNSSSRICCRRMLCYAICILLLLIIILTPFIITSSNHQDDNSYVLEQRIDEVVDFLLNKKISAESDLLMEGSPQRRAAQFMAVDDSYRVADSNLSFFVDRYVLVLMWYALGGSEWNYQHHFLSSQNQCEWFTNLYTSSGQAVRQGVLCDETGRVTEIKLRKSKVPF